MNQFITFKPAIEITDRHLVRLADKLDDCIGSEDSIAVIRRITRWGGLEAIEILASLLDSPGPIGRAAESGLVKFGADALPVLFRVLDETIDADEEMHAESAVRRIERAERRAAGLPAVPVLRDFKTAA
ncbi:MAG TPA: hypothetical protein VIF09_20105 [Polyangiaceae bacterium]|jgi:hypothetical protein